jgi:YD repeat-containing protein
MVAFGRLGTIPGMITSQSYEADGQTKAITYANGVTSNFAYSPTRRSVSEISTKDNAGTPILLRQFTRDATGRISAVTALASGNSWAYAYDDLGRLTNAANAGDPAASETLTYAMNDNLLSRTRNPLGSIAPAGTAPYVYSYPAGSGIRPHTPKPSFMLYGKRRQWPASVTLHLAPREM